MSHRIRGESRSDQGPLYGLGPVVLLLALAPWGWVGGWPWALSGLALLGIVPALRRLGLTLPCAAAAALLAIVGAVANQGQGPVSLSEDHGDRVSDALLACATEADQIARDDSLRVAARTGSRYLTFERLGELISDDVEEGNAGVVIRGADGGYLAWSGWTIGLEGADSLPSIPWVDVSHRRAHTTLRVHMPFAEGGSVTVGRPLRMARSMAPLGQRAIFGSGEGLSFPPISIALPDTVVMGALDAGLGEDLVRLDALPVDAWDEASARRRVLGWGCLLGLLLLARPVYRRHGLRGTLFGLAGLSGARLAFLDGSIWHSAIFDPGELVVPVGQWPMLEAIGIPVQDLLGSPGDTFLSVFVVGAATLLVARGLVVGCRTRWQKGISFWAMMLVVPWVFWSTRAWMTGVAMVARSAATPPFLDFTALVDPAVLFVALSVVLLGGVWMVSTVGVAAIWSRIRMPTQASPGVWPWGLGLLVAGVVHDAGGGWVAPLTLGTVGLFACRSAGWLAQGKAPSSLVRILMVGLVAIACADVLHQEQKTEFQDFAEAQAARVARHQERYQLLFLEAAIADMVTDDVLARALEGDGPGDGAAFHAWMSSGLPARGQPCAVELSDAAGVVRSLFRRDVPGTVTVPDWDTPISSVPLDSIETRRARAHVGPRETVVASGRVGVPYKAGLGLLEVTVLPDLSTAGVAGVAWADLEGNLARWGADPVVLRYRAGVMVESSTEAVSPGALLPIEAAALFVDSPNGGWRRVSFEERDFDLFWSLLPDGDVLGVGVPVGLGLDEATLVLDSLAIHGCVLLLLAVLLFAGNVGSLQHLAFQFRMRLLAAIVAVSVLPIGFLGIYGVGRLVRQADLALHSDLSRSLEIGLRGVEIDLQLAVERLLSRSTAQAWLKNSDSQSFRWPESSERTGVSGIRVYDESGLERARFGFGAPVPRRVLKQVAEKGERRFFYQDRDGFPMAVLVRPVELDGATWGAVAGFRELAPTLCSRIHELTTNEVRIYGRKGLAAASREEFVEAGLLSRLLPADAWGLLMLEGRSEFVLLEDLGFGQRLCGYRALRAADGGVVGGLAVSVPVDDVGRGSRHTDREISLVVGLSVLWLGIAVLLGLILSRRISGPLVRLMGGADRIAAGALGTQVDITGRDEVGRLAGAFNQMSRVLADNQAQLQASRNELEAVVEHQTSAVVAMDTAGDVRLSNPAAGRLLGSMADGVVVAFERQGVDQLETLVNIAAMEGQAAREVPFAADRTLQLTVVRIGDPEPAGFLVVAEDLTDVIRSQKTLAWGEMARQVAHEIKNPLTPMKLQAQNLLHAHRADRPDFSRVLEEGVALIVEQIERLRRISGEFSRLSQPARVHESDPVDLVEAVRKSLRLYQGADMNVDLEIGADVPMVDMDPEDLAKIVLNLVENAREAMGEEGIVEVSIAAAQDDGNVAEIRVSDTGPGIPQDVRKHLFEPNFSTKTSGTGLGLFIVKKIVEDAAGTVSMESRAERGTCFTLRIPGHLASDTDGK